MDCESRDSRTLRLLGSGGMERLASATVMVAGVGGVGGYCLEMLARSGVGNLVIIDSDAVAPSNINRQLIAMTDTVGQPKTELWRQRILSINPEARVTAIESFITTDNAGELLTAYRPDFLADAIDTVAPKCRLIECAVAMRISLISSMGAGGRLDPSRVRYATLAETREDGLARAVRERLKRKIDIGRLRVVFSDEAPRRNAIVELDLPNKRSSYGTLATIPAIFGIYMANHIIRKITGC